MTELVHCHCECQRGNPVFIRLLNGQQMSTILLRMLNLSNLTHLALNVPTVGNSSFPPFALCSVGAKKSPRMRAEFNLEREF